MQAKRESGTKIAGKFVEDTSDFNHVLGVPVKVLLMFAKKWIIVLPAICLLAGSLFWANKGFPHFLESQAPESAGKDAGKNAEKNATEEPESFPVLSVSTVVPKKGCMDRITVQAGSINAYQFVQMYSKVSGYLKSQAVDLGDRVKEGQVLAEIAIPEIDKTVQRNAAALAQASAKVNQMKARVVTVKAEYEAAKAGVDQAEANAKSAGAWLRFRDKQLNRIKELFALKSIDERLVDENQERYEAAVETERAAQAAVRTQNAQVAAAQAKIQQAESDEAAAEAEVLVAQSELERSEVLQSFANLRAPFDGIITQRNFFPGDYIRAANEGSSLPLLTVQRIDRMRVVVLLPDREVPFVDIGDVALIEVDAFPGEKFEAKVSRVAQTEDPQTRLMHVEIDLPNPTRKLRQGMYGKVTIVLDKAANQLSLPSRCLVGRTQAGLGTVFVVRGGKVVETPVRVGFDNGLRVAILEGLSPDDQVIFLPPLSLSDGMEVTAIAEKDY